MIRLLCLSAKRLVGSSLFSYSVAMAVWEGQRQDDNVWLMTSTSDVTYLWLGLPSNVLWCRRSYSVNRRFNRHVSFSTTAYVVSRPIVVLRYFCGVVVEIAQVLRTAEDEVIEDQSSISWSAYLRCLLATLCDKNWLWHHYGVIDGGMRRTSSGR